MSTNRTAVLAYSGGLDTTCAIAWLKEDYGFDEVVGVLVDVGQAFDLDEAILRGTAAGADDVILLDRKEAFAADQVAKAITTNALYEGKYPLVSALSRPVIAEGIASLALELGAEAVVHGCTGKGNDQLRFELAFKANYPGVKVIAPLRDTIWTREEEIAYALERGIPITVKKGSPYSIDENLFGRSIEAGMLEDPWTAPPEEPYKLTFDPDDAPAPTELVISFERGIPVALDGLELGLVDLVAELNGRAGAYGIGRIDMIENRAVGIKSREVYEAPAAMVLIQAHRALEDLVLTKAELQAEARARDALDGARLRRALVQPAAHRDRRVRGDHAAAGHRRRPARAARGGRDRQRTALGERALRRDAGFLRGGRDVPAPGGGRLHPDRRARDRARRRESAEARSGVTLWSGRTGGGEPAPEVWSFLRGDDLELLPYDCDAHPRPRRAAPRGGAA